MNKIKTFTNTQLRTDMPEIQPGDTVKVYQKIKDANPSKKGVKERVQPFEGQVICRKHRNEIGATITVRRIASGVGIEKIFPIHSPTIKKIELLKKGKARRAKLYYLRGIKGKKAKIKTMRIIQQQDQVQPESPEQETESSQQAPEETEAKPEQDQEKEQSQEKVQESPEEKQEATKENTPLPQESTQKQTQGEE